MKNDTSTFFSHQVTDLTGTDHTTCKSPVTGSSKSYAVSVYLAPNSINFRTVFAKFKNLNENAMVFSLVISSIVVYIILVVWARLSDKEDLVKVSYILNHYCI